MQKSLEQIQQENRKFILEAIHGCSYEEALKIEEQEIVKNSFFRNNFLIREYIAPENIYIHFGKPLTLSRVLLASIKSGKCMDCFEHKNNKYCSSEWHVDREENLSRIRNFILDNWKNLELETLEEQSEETQRGLNKFFND